MNPDNNRLDLFALHAGQLPVLGRLGQRKLSRATVLIIGGGRVGSSVALGSHAAGVGRIKCVDLQNMEVEQLGPCHFAKTADLGRRKVSVLADLLKDRPAGVIEPIAAAFDAQSTDQLIADVSFVISCPNKKAPRLLAERQAIARGIPIMQVAAFGGQKQLGGMITLHLPEMRKLACYGCLVPDAKETSTAGALLTSATAVLGHVAAHLASLLLAGCRDQELRSHNLVLIDLERLSMERLAVSRRPGCEICRI